MLYIYIFFFENLIFENYAILKKVLLLAKVVGFWRDTLYMSSML
jgi:hypothetical protein